MSKANFDPRDRTGRVVQTGIGPSFKPIYGDPSTKRLRLMARSGGYVMVRYPRCSPFVLTEKEWARLPLFLAQPQEPTR